MRSSALICAALLYICTAAIGIPETINIQGSLEAPGGGPLVGAFDYRIGYYDMEIGGSELAVATGEVTTSSAGRFSIGAEFPENLLDAEELWYELAIDTAGDGIQGSDFFPERIQIHSVPFAHTIIRQGPGSGLNADLLDGVNASGFASASHPHNIQDLAGMVTDQQVPNDITIDHASTANALTGMLNDPGDQVLLGGGVILQVGADGEIEFKVGDKRFRLAGQRWEDPRSPLDSPSPEGSHAEQPRVALAENGDALVVWHQFQGAMRQIFRSEYRDGNWKDPSGLLDFISFAGEDALFPEVAMNRHGDAIIVWVQSDGAIDQIFFSEYRNGVWSSPIDLSDNASPDSQDAFLPRVAMSDNGDAVIVWTQSDGTHNHIFRSEYRNGSWIHPQDLSDHVSLDGQSAVSPQVSINSEGETLIVWEQFDGVESQVYRSEYRNGVWNDPSDLSEGIAPPGGVSGGQQVAINDDGEAIIVWVQSNGTRPQIFRSEFFDGSWDDPTDLTDNFSLDQENASSPVVDLNNSGEAIIAWLQLVTTRVGTKNDQVFRSERRSGVWIDPVDLNDNFSPGGTRSYLPDVDINNHGDAIIVWRQFDGERTPIYRSEYKNGNWIDPPDLTDNISPHMGGPLRPKVALNDNEDAIIVWFQDVGTHLQVFRSEYRFGF